MMRPHQIAVQAVFLLSLLARGVEPFGTCDEGWVFHDDVCYLKRVEYESFQFAHNTCQMFGADLAFAENEATLKFLQSYVAKQDNYGWWYGVKIDAEGDVRIYDERDNAYVLPEDEPEDGFALPEEKKIGEPSTGCVGLLRDETLKDVEYRMTDVPCEVKLPYVCRGDARTMTKPKSIHAVQNNSVDIYWFSSNYDKKTYSQAEKSCRDKKMSLLSISGDLQIDFLLEQFDKRQGMHVDPWWIGLRTEKGSYSWSNGVPLQNDVVLWQREEEENYAECRILLSDGSMDQRACDEVKAPFICARPHRRTGEFGCHANWVRAGQSCYFLASRYSEPYSSHGEAEKVCAKRGGHPISIDSTSEKLWLLQSTLYEETSGKMVWTSLTDKKTAGEFVWADGAKANRALVKWSTGSTLADGGFCFIFGPGGKVLFKWNCAEDAQPGCQYKVQGSGTTCVTKNWKYFKGNCYFNPGTNPKTLSPYPAQLHRCYQDVVDYNQEIVITPLKIESKAVMDFISTFLPKYVFVWVGLKETSKGVFSWFGSKATADISFFKTDHDTGNLKKGDQCAVMDRHGMFQAKPCGDCDCGVILCEKEVPYHGSAASSQYIAPRLVAVWVVLTLSSVLL